MTIYIDSDYKCHASNDGTMRAVELREDEIFFENKCTEYIEAFRYIPEGETWTREDGEVFNGCMIAPWKDLADALEAQHNYELEQLARLAEEAKTAVSLSEMDEAYREGVNSV